MENMVTSQIDKVGGTVNIEIHNWGYAVPITLIIAFVAFMFLTRNEMPSFMKNDLEEQFEGKVDSLFLDKQDHGTKKAVLSSGYIYFMPGKWESLIAIGDSLSKKKNVLEIRVYRDGQPKVVLDYRDTYKKEK